MNYLFLYFKFKIRGLFPCIYMHNTYIFRVVCLGFTNEQNQTKL